MNLPFLFQMGAMKFAGLFLILNLLLGAASPLAQAAESSPEDVVRQALELRLDQNRQWWNLLNYRRDYYFWKRSQADSPKFFLSEKGRWSPREELITMIRQIYNPQFTEKSPDGSLNERAQCLFPGRFLWLQRNLKNVQWPEVNCQRFDNFKNILNAHSVTYVFSSYYLNNPSSAYGHSFLRLNRGEHAEGGRHFELLDFGVGYSAIPTSSNVLVYSLAGIFGFFPGRFEANPYYYKVREYNDFESRDLWEYDLNMSQDEVNLLVAHVFELDRGGFDYVYTSENCSYRILAALDAVNPSWNLIPRTKVEVVPSDTIRLVYKTPGLVTAVHYRPSSRAIFMTRLESLPKDLQKAVKQFSVDENIEKLVANRNELEKQQLLDTAMDYVDFKFAEDVLKEKGHFALKKKILMARSEVSLISPPLVVPAPIQESPGVAHESSRFHIGYLNRDNSGAITLGHSFALHDLLDPVIGYPANSQIGMMDFDARLGTEQNRTLQVEEFNFVNIISLSPSTDFNSTPSWRFQLALKRTYKDDCQNCLPLSINGGIGYSKEFVPGLVAGLWLRGAVAYSPEFYGERILPGLGPAFLGRYYYGDKVSVLAEAFYRYDYRAIRNDVREASLGAQFNFTKDFGLRFFSVSDRQYRAEFEYYY